MVFSISLNDLVKDITKWWKKDEKEKLAHKLSAELISHLSENCFMGVHFYRRGRYWRSNEGWDCLSVFEDELEIENVTEKTIHKWVELMMIYSVAKREESILYPCGELVEHCSLIKADT